MSEDRERVVVVVPTEHSVHVDTEFAIKNYMLPDQRFRVGLLYPRDAFAKGAAQMRNLGIKQALEVEPPPEWMVFLDSDTVPQGNPFDAIAEGGGDVIVLMTPVWAASQNPIDPVWSNVWIAGEDGEPEPRWIDYENEGPFVPILKAGAGCMIVRTEILRENPSLRFLPSLNDDFLWEKSEDLGFCDRARELGYSVTLYTPVLCGHYQNIDISKVHDAVQYWKQVATDALRRVRELEEEAYAVVN